MLREIDEVEQVWEPLRALAWADLETVAAASRAALETLATRPELLPTLLDRVPNSTDLRALCESYDILDKLVLHNEPAGFLLRLHVFRPGYFDRPHNHRWPYSSRILSGSYEHILYGTPAERHFKLSDLTPSVLRIERVGDTYTLDHRMVHSIRAAGDTVSLVLRGPSIIDDFVVADTVTGEVWTQHGAANESAEEQAQKRMPAGRLADVIAYVRETIGG